MSLRTPTHYSGVRVPSLGVMMVEGHSIGGFLKEIAQRDFLHSCSTFQKLWGPLSGAGDIKWGLTPKP